MTIALITAAGIGSRMHSDIPKQFICVDNKPIIFYTLEAFQNHPGIDSIVLVTLESWRSLVEAYAKQYNLTKLKWIVPGGSNGQESIRNGLEAIAGVAEKDEFIVIHDGNRPLVSSELISDALAVCSKHGNAVAAIPCVEVVFESENFGPSEKEIARDKIVRTQTPHIYKYGDLIEAHQEAQKREIKNTAATCVLMRVLGRKIYFSTGSVINFKITTKSDLEIFRSIIFSCKHAVNV